MENNFQEQIKYFLHQKKYALVSMVIWIFCPTKAKTPDQKLVNNTSVNGNQTFEYVIIILYFPRLSCLFPQKKMFQGTKMKNSRQDLLNIR